MAYLKHLTIHTNTHLTNSLKYVTNDKKTNEELITGINCDYTNVTDDFKFAKVLHQKEKTKIIAHSYIQSFKPGEVDEETANEIGVKFINKIAPGYQAVVVTHNDKEHIHNHIIINSVNLYTGYMYKANKESYRNAREENDKLAIEYGLSVIPYNKYSKGIDQETYRIAERGESWKIKMLNSIDESIAFSNTKDEFIDYMKSLGYEIKWQNKNISIKDPAEQKKFIRVKRLGEQFGEDYSMNGIERRLGIEGSDLNKQNREDRRNEKEQYESNSDTINENGRTEQSNIAAATRSPGKSKEYEKRNRNVERERYEKWKATQDREIQQSVNLSHIDDHIFKITSVLNKATNNKNKDNAKDETLNIFILIALMFLKARRNYKLHKAEKIRYKVLRARGNLRIGNISYNDLKNIEGENKYIKLNVNEIKKLRENANFKYTGIIKDNKITVMIKKYDLEKLLDLVGRKYEKQFGNTTYKFIKDHSNKVLYRVVDEKMIKILMEDNSLKFACFKKEDKFNIAFDNKDLNKYIEISNGRNKEIYK